MGRAPSFCGVILAAGESSRMGRPKALLPWGRGTFLSAAIRALTPYTDLVIVAAGRDAAIVTLVDRPPVAAATVHHLRHEYLRLIRSDKIWTVIPEHNGQHGH